MRQAYVVIERHPGHHALQPAWRTAAALRRGERDRRKNRNRACRPAPAERHSSRYQAEQHHVSPLRRSRADRFRAVASQPVAGSAAGGVPDSLRHRALYGARAPARGARRSAQRPVFAGRAVVFLHHRRAAVRRERNPARDAAAAVARSLSAAQTQGRLSALAAGNRAAVSGDRSGLALSHGIATRLRPRPSRPGQADGAGGAAEPRSHLHRLAPPLQRQSDAAARQSRCRRPTGVGSDRDDRARRLGGIARAERGAARHRRTNPGDAARGAARLPERAETRPRHHRPDAGRGGQQQACRPPGGAAALGAAVEAR